MQEDVPRESRDLDQIMDSLAPRFQELPDARESVGIRSLSSGANIHH